MAKERPTSITIMHNKSAGFRPCLSLYANVVNDYKDTVPAPLLMVFAMEAVEYVYEVRPRKDHRGVDLISDALPFGRLWYDTPDNAIGYAMHSSRAHHAVIRVYDDGGNIIETHEHKGISERRRTKNAPRGIELTVRQDPKAALRGSKSPVSANLRSTAVGSSDSEMIGSVRG